MMKIYTCIATAHDLRLVVADVRRNKHRLGEQQPRNRAGAAPDDMIGTDIAAWLPDGAARARLLSQPDMPIETELRGASRTDLRPIDCGQPHQAIAVRDLRSRREAERHIRYLALHDALTALPNRSTFNTRLDQQISRSPRTQAPFSRSANR